MIFFLVLMYIKFSLFAQFVSFMLQTCAIMVYVKGRGKVLKGIDYPKNESPITLSRTKEYYGSQW